MYLRFNNIRIMWGWVWQNWVRQNYRYFWYGCLGVWDLIYLYSAHHNLCIYHVPSHKFKSKFTNILHSQPIHPHIKPSYTILIIITFVHFAISFLIAAARAVDNLLLVQVVCCTRPVAKWFNTLMHHNSELFEKYSSFRTERNVKRPFMLARKLR